MDVPFPMSIFRLYPGLELSFEHKSTGRNLFLRACFFSGSRLSVREIEKKIKFGGTIGDGYSYLVFQFRHSKVFRINAILHDAPGAVRAHSGKGPESCYTIGRGPNSFLLGHVTGLLFCLYVKRFLPSIFNSIDIWSSMSCIVLDFEVADINVFREFGFSLMEKFRDTHFALHESTNPQSKQAGVPKTWAELCRTVDVWISVSFPTLFSVT